MESATGSGIVYIPVKGEVSQLPLVDAAAAAAVPCELWGIRFKFGISLVHFDAN